MTALVQINQGTAPAGVDGDTVRAAFTKVNLNTSTLSTQIPLNTMYLPDSNTTLDASYVGKRVGVLMTVAGRIVVLPRASTTPSDQCILFYNLGQTVTIGFQGSDGSELNQLNFGDWVIYVSDGNAYWHVLQRGRNSWNETVGGSLTVGGNMSAAGKIQGVNSPNLLLNGSAEFGLLGWAGPFLANLNDTGGGTGSSFYCPALAGATILQTGANIPVGPNVPLTLSARMLTSGMTAGLFSVRLEAFDSSNASKGFLCIIQVAPGSPWVYKYATGATPAGTAYVKAEFYCDGSPAGPAYAADIKQIKVELGSVPSLYSQEASIAYLGGAPALTGRPTFAGKIPWDTGNLVTPAQQTTVNTYTQPQTYSGLGTTYNTCPILVANPSTGYPTVALANSTNGGCIRYNSTGNYFETLNSIASAYIGITVLSVIQTSDRDLKTNIEVLPSVMARLRTKRIVSYRMKAAAIDAESDRVHYGAIAQEWQDDFPELVIETSTEIDADGDFIAHQYDDRGVEIFGPGGKPESRKALGFDYSGAAAVALAGLIETDTTIAAMQQRIDELESKLAVVLAKVAV